LLSNKPEIDVEKAIDDAVAWANAERLAVTVEYLTEWGFSPQRGTGKAGDTRKGFAFTVEFTPSAAYGFEQWIALPTGSFDPAAGPGQDLNGQ
jgi:hypothetical protein